LGAVSLLASLEALAVTPLVMALRKGGVLDWEAPVATYPHTLTVDLGREYALSAMRWVSRRGNPNGRVKTLVLEFSTDGSHWTGTDRREGLGSVLG
jgi:hypothetical protein